MEFGINQVRDLIPNGRNITVTEETKYEYVKHVCQMKMTGAIRQQLSAFLEGFYDIIPKKLISIFNEQELELLLSGLPNIDIEDLKSNTEYHKYQQNSLQVGFFCLTEIIFSLQLAILEWHSFCHQYDGCKLGNWLFKILFIST